MLPAASEGIRYEEQQVSKIVPHWCLLKNRHVTKFAWTIYIYISSLLKWGFIKTFSFLILLFIQIGCLKWMIYFLYLLYMLFFIFRTFIFCLLIFGSSDSLHCNIFRRNVIPPRPAEFSGDLRRQSTYFPFECHWHSLFEGHKININPTHLPAFTYTW